MPEKGLQNHLQVHLSTGEAEFVRSLANQNMDSMSNVIRAAVGVLKKLEVLREMTPEQRAQLPTPIVAFLLDPYPHKGWLE